MINQTIKTRLFGSSIAFILTVTGLAPTSSWSAETEKGAKPMMDGKMKMQCQEMMEAKEKMAAKMKEQDAALATKVAAMNVATSDQKLTLMAGLITELVDQRTAMHEEKAKMEEKMMKHMMGHMDMGKKSMSGCPMMTGTKDAPKEAKDADTVEPK